MARGVLVAGGTGALGVLNPTVTPGLIPFGLGSPGVPPQPGLFDGPTPKAAVPSVLL